MMIYLLKMITCSAAFYVLYALLFQKEKMLVFNRFYLLSSLVISFFIPLITITVQAPAADQYWEYNTGRQQPAGWSIGDYLSYAEQNMKPAG
ncbi:MAG: hypothetical protein QM640_14710 [Niabella sp.]